MEEVNGFRYLGIYNSKDGTVEKEISSRIRLASAAFKSLDNVWISKTYKTRIKHKVNIYKSRVRCVSLWF